MQDASTRWYTYGTIWNGTNVYHMYHLFHIYIYIGNIYLHRKNINGTVYDAVEGGKGGGGKDDESTRTAGGHRARGDPT